jgi:hypothetical protein
MKHSVKRLDEGLYERLDKTADKYAKKPRIKKPGIKPGWESRA